MICRLNLSGVVLRGVKTTIVATGSSTRNLVEIGGSSSSVQSTNIRTKIQDLYVPVGARSFHVADASLFHVGDSIKVVRIGNTAWISLIGMEYIMPRR